MDHRRLLSVRMVVQGVIALAGLVMIALGIVELQQPNGGQDAWLFLAVGILIVGVAAAYMISLARARGKEPK